MQRLKRIVHEEAERWRNLYRLLTGRGIDPTIKADPLATEEEDALTDDYNQSTAAVVAEVAEETRAREERANADLMKIRHAYHEANQPLTVARAKASMLKNVVREVR